MTNGRIAPSPPAQFRILLTWMTANFILIGAVSWRAGGWYLGWETSPAITMLVELGLIILPNLILPMVVLRYWWPNPIVSIRSTLGWVWNGWRSIIVGTGAFLLAIGWTSATDFLLGESIPYNLPGNGGTFQVENPVGVLGLFLLLIAFVLLTAAAEETMFRGFIQTQIGERYGTWLGILMGVLLFGLRHLPADIFYAHAWGATARMWMARQIQLYGAALLFGLARNFGRSTYAPATLHVLLLITALFG